MATLMKTRALWTPVSKSVPTLSRSFHVSTSYQQMAAVDEVEVKNARPFKDIPGPPSYPLVGSLFSMITDPAFDSKAFHRYYFKQAEKYGPVFTMKIPNMNPFVIVTNPDHIEKMIRLTMNEPLRTPMLSLKKVREEATNDYFEKKTGILLENGEEWWRVRSRVQTPMMKPKMVGTYLKKMDEVSVEFMDRIAELQALHGEMPSDFQFELYKWALESVGLVALNRRQGCLNPNASAESLKLIEIVNDIFEVLNETEVGSPAWRIFPFIETSGLKKLKKKHEHFLEVAVQSIRETEEALSKKDPGSDEELTLMETLLLTDGLSRKDVVTLILDMLFAGIDTTSHTLGFTLYLLARNPQVQAKLQAEVDAVLGQHEGPLLPKHMAQFSYLKSVLKESMRIFPLVIGTGRELSDDTVLGGYHIPKGVTVIGLTMLAARNEKLFPRPDEFIPERWLRDRPLGDIHPFASLPFGAGTRMCIGRRIAEQEMYTFLARVMQRFSVDYKYQDMDIHSRLVFVPSEPLRFSFTERK